MSNLRHAGRQVADVHHIVGDVHYLAFGLPANRLMLTIHDCAALNRLTGLKRSLLRYFWFAGPLRRAKLVTTISAAMKSELQRHFGATAEKVRVIPNCVRKEFTPAPKEFNHSSPVVLQVGTAWNKNVERVAAALRGTPCRLEIVGEMSPAQRQAVASTGIEWRELGALSDAELVGAYRRCDLVIFASLYEGFGLPILEAQATGRPVITSNRSSMPEAAGDGSLMVNPESIESIRAALCSVIQQAGLRCRLVDQGFVNVKRFQPEEVAARYAALYREISATVQ
ncbi:MAG: glycosyltransferase family 4 protein [Verrucomicrobiota bacterium]